jgi:hypothetical protein
MITAIGLITTTAIAPICQCQVNNSTSHGYQQAKRDQSKNT